MRWVTDALAIALWRRANHSDRGIPYAAADCQQLLPEHGIDSSMSDKERKSVMQLTTRGRYVSVCSHAYAKPSPQSRLIQEGQCSAAEPQKNACSIARDRYGAGNTRGGG